MGFLPYFQISTAVVRNVSSVSLYTCGVIFGGQLLRSGSAVLESVCVEKVASGAQAVAQ